MVGHYKARWELDPKYSAWIKRCGDDTKFACKACARSYCIAEMYEQALDRHLEGGFHKKNMEAWLKLQTSKTYFTLGDLLFSLCRGHTTQEAEEAFELKRKLDVIQTSLDENRSKVAKLNK